MHALDLGSVVCSNLPLDQQPLLVELPVDAPESLDFRMPTGCDVKAMESAVSVAGGQITKIDRDHPEYWLFRVRDLRIEPEAAVPSAANRPTGYRGRWADWYKPDERRS